MMNNGPAVPPYMMNMNGAVHPQQQMPMKPPYTKALVVRTDMLNMFVQQRNDDNIESWHANFLAQNGTKPSRKRRLSNSMAAQSPMYPNPGMPGSNGAPQNGGMTPTNVMPQSSGVPPDYSQMQPQNSGMNEFYQPMSNMSNQGLPPPQMSMDMQQQQMQQQHLQQQQIQSQQLQQQQQQQQIQQQQAMLNNGCMTPQMQQAMNGGQYEVKMEMKKDEDDHPLRRIERMTEQQLDPSPKVNQRSNDKKQNEDRQQKMAKLETIANALNLPNGQQPMMPMPNMRPPYIPPGHMPQGFDPSQMMRPPNMMMPPGVDPNGMPPMYNGMPPSSMPQPSPSFPMMVNSPAHSQNGMMPPGQYPNMPAGMSPKFQPMMPSAMMSPQTMRPPMLPQFNGMNPEMMAGMRPPMPPMGHPGNMPPEMWQQHQMFMHHQQQQQQMQAQMSHQQ